MGLGFAPTWIRQVSPPPLLHVLTTVYRVSSVCVCVGGGWSYLTGVCCTELTSRAVPAGRTATVSG